MGGYSDFPELISLYCFVECLGIVEQLKEDETPGNTTKRQNADYEEKIGSSPSLTTAFSSKALP